MQCRCNPAERCHTGRSQLSDDGGDVCGPRSRHGSPRGQGRPRGAIIDHVATKASQDTTRALAAARAALVRSEIAFASCSATAARIWIVRLISKLGGPPTSGLRLAHAAIPRTHTAASL